MEGYLFIFPSLTVDPFMLLIVDPLLAFFFLFLFKFLKTYDVRSLVDSSFFGLFGLLLGSLSSNE